MLFLDVSICADWSTGYSAFHSLGDLEKSHHLFLNVAESFFVGRTGFTCPVPTPSHPSHRSHLQQRAFRGCGVSCVFACFFVVFVCGLVFWFVCWFSVFWFCFLFPASLHALALSLTGAQRTDSSFASKLCRTHWAGTFPP